MLLHEDSYLGFDVIGVAGLGEGDALFCSAFADADFYDELWVSLGLLMNGWRGFICEL